MTTTRKKRPRDPVQFAKLIGDIATGQTPDAEDDGKDAAAAELGQAVENVFGADVDYAQLVKIYGQSAEAQKRYSPAECVGCRREAITGNPDPDPEHVSTSYAERQNLTMRMSLRRFTRLTNGFSKDVVNHQHALAICFMHYNFARQHQTLRVSPAMAAGVTGKLWELADIVAMIDAVAPLPAKRGPYKKRAG